MRFLAVATLVGISASADPKPVSHDMLVPGLVAQLPTENNSPQGFLFRDDSQPSDIIFNEGWDPQTSRSRPYTGRAGSVSLTRHVSFAV